MPEVRGNLCETCLFCRVVISGKGSRFVRCELSTKDKRFPKYPPQPIFQCPGHRLRDSLGEKECS